MDATKELLKNFQNSHDIDKKILNQVISMQSKLAEADFDLNSFLNLVVNQMQILTPASGVVVEMVEGNEMVYRAATGTVSNHIGLRLDLNKSISGMCVKSNTVLRSDDTETDSRVDLKACRLIQARSMLVAPLIHEGKAIGVLKILSNEANKFSEQDVKILKLMAGFIASAIAHQLLYEENDNLLKDLTKAFNELQQTKEMLEHLAHHDPLTLLPNRRYFSDKLTLAMSRIKRTGLLLSVLYLDIDHFKAINDNLGHDCGDELLKTYSSRLKECLRDYDTIARLGGDEFIILLEDIHDKEEAIVVAKKIIETNRQKFKIKNNILKITGSIGITFYNGIIKKPEAVIKEADLALYQAKKTGRNKFVIYDSLLQIPSVADQPKHK